MNRLFYFFILLFVFCYQSGEAQILDDSTKLIYGPHTTGYVLQEDIYTNSGKYYHADTSISGFHNYDFLYNGKLSYQNLGNLGTSLSSIYPLMPRHIGKSFGFYSYNLYAFDPEKIKYYDTRSPFSFVNYVQGTNGQQLIDALFTLNFTSRWNVGFEINKFTSKKLIGQPLSNAKQADHTSLVFFTRYFTKDSTYQLLANFSFMDHKVFETGGVVKDTAEGNINEFYAYKKQPGFLHNSRSFELSHNFHLFHQLSPFKDPTLQLFHELDYKYQSNRFNSQLNPTLPNDTAFYPNRDIALPVFFDLNATTDRSDFILLENKGGLKGKRGVIYYKAYFKNRLFNYKQYYFLYNRQFYENYLGGEATVDLPIKGQVNLLGEFLVSRDSQTEARMPSGNKMDYQFLGEYKSEYLNAGYHIMNVSPALLPIIYVGNNFFWDNEAKFSPTTINKIFASGTIKYRNLTLNPEVNLMTIHDYIYFDNLALPAQFSGTINYVSADLFLKYNIRKFYLEDLVKYSKASDIIQVPTLYNHSRIYYQDRWFKNAILLQIGFDVFYRQGYYANQYMPITQQFYLNQGNGSFILPDYFNADFFVNVRIKSANAFLKMANFNQSPLGPGNMITPYYPVPRANFEFGIKWLFFD